MCCHGYLAFAYHSKTDFNNWNVLEMVTVCTSPRSPSEANSIDVQTEADYLKVAKKGGGHKG